MSPHSKKHQNGCPVANGVDTFGDRWTLLIIRDMMLLGKKTFGGFQNGEEHISTNILANRLKHLEIEGIVFKSLNPDNRRSYLYTLTPKGIALAPVIFEIISWSGKYTQLRPEHKGLLSRIENDRQNLLVEIHRP